MRKIFTTLLFLYLFNAVFAQNVQLKSNGFVSEFRPIDTLYYAEYRLGGNSVTNLKKQDPNALILRQSFGRTFKKSPEASQDVFYTTKYYAYSDGTLQAPTSQLFFKPVEIERFKKEVKNIGVVEEHPFLKGYYFLNITDKNWLNGEKIFALCNTLYESRLAEMIEPVFVKQIKVENPLRPWQWNIRNNANVQGGTIGADMNVENAWNMGATGAGIRVAVIDDGVDLTHPDLVNNLLPGFDATGNNSGGAPAIDNGHGTNCAGIIAATDNTDGVIGVAFDAQIIPIRMGIVNTVTGTFNTNDTWIVNCFNEAVNRGADVISCSWGGGSPSTQINAAIQNAVNNGRGGDGSIVLFAAGNDNTSINYPASNPSVIAVGASSTCDTRKRSSSNPALVNPGVSTDPENTSCDGEFWWGSNFGTGLDVLAPGVWISTTDNVGANGFVAGNFNDHFNGTSSACPNTAAVVALILSVNPNLTGVQARNILEQTCFKIPNGNFQSNVSGQPNGTWSSQAGYGRVDAGAAVCATFENAMTLTGPSLVCTSAATVTLNNAPTGAAVTWEATPTNLFAASSGSGVSASLSAANSSVSGQGTLTFSTATGCGNPIQVQRTLWVGKPSYSGVTIVRDINDPNQNVSYVYGYSNARQFYVSVASGVSNYQWTITGNQSCGSSYNGPRFYSNGNGTQATTTTNKINVNMGTCTGTFWIQCKAVNNCGETYYSQRLFSVTNNPGGGCDYSLSTYPNPSEMDGEVTINLVPPPPGCDNAIATSSSIETIAADEISSVMIVDDLGNPIRNESGSGAIHVLYTNNLRRGVYFLNVQTTQGRIFQTRIAKN